MTTQAGDEGRDHFGEPRVEITVSYLECLVTTCKYHFHSLRALPSPELMTHNQTFSKPPLRDSG